ncbi:MAG: C25 family cysteine peptidase [Bacteroidales bacterium]|jgi:hypothetical protein|nr:C25 family cysteine peptidase [Bacteroidales bacterium]
MKKIAAYIISLFLSCALFAQSGNNGWIQYNQSYVKIPIANQGVYKITGANLRSLLGVAPSTKFSLPYIQLIHAGKQVPLYLSNNTGIFADGDYIEFYAPGGNTGWLDTAVSYTKPLNDAYSLYNDTAAYFLTFPSAEPCLQYNRSTPSTNFSAYTPLTYCLATVRQNYSASYNTTAPAPYILDAEGWCDAAFNMTATSAKTYTLASPNFANVGVPSIIRFGVAGVSETRHDISVGINTTGAAQRFDTTYYNFNAVHKTLRTSGALPATTQFSFQSFAGNGKTADQNSVVYIEITYPRNYDFAGAKSFGFTIPKQSSNKDYLLLKITNFDGGTAPILYIPEIQQRIVLTQNGADYQVLVPNVLKDLHCFAVNPSEIKSAGGKIVNTKNTTVKGDFFDMSNSKNQGDFVIITHSSLWNEARQYAAYRDSTGKKTIVIDVEELYNQFAYGIGKHPVAIHEFIRFAQAQWSIKPENFLIIGKGYKITDFRKNAALYEQTLVPTMGYPGSDILFTISNHKSTMNTFRTPASIGRIAAQTGADVINYLNKVRLYEAQTPAAWMKTVMHFGGGSNQSEQTEIKGYLKGFETAITGSYFGANVSTFLKSSSDIFEKTEPDIISKNMNAGTSILNFFGHASGSSFDQTIDDPILFNNEGKYPLLIANSCYSGDIFSTNPSGINEKWIFNTPMKGAIAFVANIDVGIPPYLNLFTASLVRNIAYYNYNKSLGSSMMLTVKELGQKNYNFESVIYSMLSMNYHGDPSIVIGGFDLPDYEIRTSSFQFSPQIISTDLSNFNVNVSVYNNGRATGDSCLLRLNAFSAQTNQLVATRDTIVRNIFSVDTVTITFNTTNFSAGNFNVEATVLPITRISQDSVNKLIDRSRLVYFRPIEGDSIPCLQLAELVETNNTARSTVFITAQDVLPAFPPNFAIIPYDTVSLVVVAVDPLNPPRTLYLEIDTTLSFNSDLRFPKTFRENTESIVTWKPNIKLLENVTYYWRVWASDSSEWRVSSFVYEKGKNGWAQQHKGQFTDYVLSSNNTLSYLTYDMKTQQYDFEQSIHDVSCYNRNMEIPKPGGGTYPDSYYFDTRYILDVTQMQTSAYPITSAAFNVVVFDSTTSIPWLSDRPNCGHWNDRPNRWNGFVRSYLGFLSADTTYQMNLANFFDTIVPNGNFILVYSFGNVKTIRQELKDAFSRLGAQIPQNDETENYSYIMFCQKGNPASVQEVKSTTDGEKINLSTSFESKRIQGTITTPFIGPSHHFETALWGKTLLDDADASTISTTAFLPDQGNHFAVKLPAGSDTVQLNSLVNANLTPYLRLQNTMQDQTYRTASKLNFWKVYFDPVGELSIYADAYFNLKFHADSIVQGDTLRAKIDVRNISYTAMDSVLMHFEIRNSAQELVVSEYQRIAPVGAKESVIAFFNHSTQSLTQGNYTLHVEANPVNPETGIYDQLENLHFNNIIFHPFYVYCDLTKPSLDVTFDNRHLLNGDYVSSKPNILISLFDENQFLLLQDTSHFTIYVRNVATNVSEQYFFAHNTLQFAPAQAQWNSCQALFTPQLADGTYELIVYARDASGNTHDKPYTIQFKVQGKSQISSLYNFPNPAHDYTTFRIVLSGAVLPRDAKISIYSLTGDIVHEIPLRDLHIGTNDVTVYWNTSMKNMAPGVYTYHLSYTNEKDFGTLPNTTGGVIKSGSQKLIIR